MSGANKCQGASWSEEFDDKELRGALVGERDLELRRCLVFRTSSTHPSSSATVWYADYKV